MNRTRFPWAAVAVLALLPAVAVAGEAEDMFNTDFGERYKQVTATPDVADDLALATQMLVAAKAKDMPPALVDLLCEKVYGLSFPIRPGYDTAAEAMEFMAAQSPDKAAACWDKVLDDLFDGCPVVLASKNRLDVPLVPSGKVARNHVLKFSAAEIEHLSVYPGEIPVCSDLDQVHTGVPGCELCHFHMILGLTEESTYLVQIHHEKLWVVVLSQEQALLGSDPGARVGVVPPPTQTRQHPFTRKACLRCS